MRTLAAVLVCLVIVPAGVFAWATTSQAGHEWSVSEVREVLAAQGFQGIATQPRSGLHGKTAAERQAFKQVRGLVFGRWRGGLAIMFVMSDYSSARGLYQLAQREGARFGAGRLKGAAVGNVLIDYIRPASGPDRVQALVAALSR